MTCILPRAFGLAVLALAAVPAGASAQQIYAPQAPAPAGSPNPVCQRLEGQLTGIERGSNDPARADQIKRYEDAANRQQGELDRTVAQSQRLGCERSGFFSFGTQPAQCGPLGNQIQQMRDNLNKMLSDLQKLRDVGADYERDGQRRAILAALARNDCGPQYRTANAPPQSRGLFDTLFGAGSVFSPDNAPGAGGGGYRTICVRTCDGFFFPISFATTQSRFRDDERQCQRTCPASEVVLFSYRNPGEDVSQAVSLSGRLYTELPNAFKYRQEVNPACSCRRAGESWADALKNLDDRSTIEQGDIIVTDQRSKAMAQPTKDAQGRPVRPANAKPGAKVQDTAPPEPKQPATADATAGDSAAKPAVRSVGPQLFPVR